MKKTFVRAAQALSMMVMAAAVITTSYFTYAAGMADIQVYCNDLWTATVDAAAAAWCSVSPVSGNGDGFVTITVTANTIPSGGIAPSP
jgi:hypothetical protein